jgi:hypothetical protein
MIRNEVNVAYLKALILEEMKKSNEKWRLGRVEHIALMGK